MSLILDALRKSDAERQRRATDTLRTGPGPVSGNNPPRWLWWLLGLATLVSTTAAVTLALRVPPGSTAGAVPRNMENRAPAEVRPLIEELQAEETTTTRTEPPTATETAEKENGNDVAPSMDAASSDAATENPAAGDETLLTAPALSAMPESFRKSLPELTINAHAWAEVPTDRFVLINFRRYAEGDKLREGPLLRQIQPDGVILEFRGETFFLPR